MGLWKMQIIYNAEPTPARFHLSDAFYKIILGPVGSSKSSCCCWELWRRANEQAPGPDGIRHTRFGIVRNTYRELLDSSLRTWLDWFPETAVGKFNKGDMVHPIKWRDIECEVLFRALDRPDDVKKLLSVEYTGIWINEVREVPKAIVDASGDRVERYPSIKDGGCTWAGVIMDSNMPDDDHWIFRFEQDPPKSWEFFRQAGGLFENEGKFFHNPDAENLQNLPEDYYIKRMEGKDADYVRVYYCAQYGFVKEGKPVHPEYVDNTHCAKENIEPVKGIPLVIGMDFGLTPACVFSQKLPNGQELIFDEIATEDIGVKNFGELLLKPKINSEYPGFEMEFFGDKGAARAETDEETAYSILNAMGIPAKPIYTSSSSLRREALSEPMRRMIDGKPGFIVNPKCEQLRKGLSGRYCYKRIKVAGDEKYHDVPDKNFWSHISESCQNAMVGAGEGKALIKKPYKPKPINHQPGQPGGWMG